MDDQDNTDETSDDNTSPSDETDDDEDQNFMDDNNSDSTEDSDTDNSENQNDQSDNEENKDDYDINKIEEELFSSLTPEQVAIKNYELKNQFIELYSIIGSTLVRINDITKSNENINILKFITEKLLELREMIDFNITTAYQTRTYIENNIIYQQCIATLNTIADIINNIPKLNDDNENKDGVPVETDDEDEVKSLDISDASASTYQEESTEYNSLF